MHLLTCNSDGKLCITRDLAEKDIPPYAILSHTWGQDEEEVSFHDIGSGLGKTKAGYAKIEFCRKQASQDGWQHYWVDTCCIDKANLTELSKSINSMYRWYQCAQVCYVYLADVSSGQDSIEETSDSYQVDRPWEISFRKSRWFQRGWTLQELLAPHKVVFYSREGAVLGTKRGLKDLISEITSIPTAALDGQPLSQFSVSERIEWTQGRATKEEEDQAYCLLGIFNVYMPLIYGEGENAFRRLRKEINDQHNGNGYAYSCDDSLFQSPKPRVRELESEQTVTEAYGVRPCSGIPGTRMHLNSMKKCQCAYNDLTTSATLRKVLGQLSVRLFCKKCAKFSTEVVIWLPGWLAQRNIYFVGERLASGSPSFGLTLQRRIPWGRNDSVLRFCLSKDLVGTKQILLSGKASLYDIDLNHGMTALHYAVQKGAIDICQFLLHMGANPNFEDANRRTAMQRAWEQILTDRGPSHVINRLRELFCGHSLNEWSFSHLHMVVLKQRPIALSIQLQASHCKEQLNSLDAIGRTPLHWAAIRGDYKAVIELLEAGASVDLVDDAGAAPLTLGASTGSIAIINWLVSCGADVNRKTFKGDTALHYASRYQRCVAPVRQLIRLGASIDCKNKFDNTPLTNAAIANRWEICEHLIKCKANIHNQGMYGDTPLFETIYHNSNECMSVLLKHGARTTDLNFDSRSIFHAAALEANIETVKLLMDTNMAMPSSQLENAQHETAWQVFQKRSCSPEGFGHLFRQLLDRSIDTDLAETDHAFGHTVLQE